MLVKVKVAQSCPTLCDPMDFTVHGTLQARKLEWVVFPFSRGSFQARDRTQVSCIAGGFFISWATKEAWIMLVSLCKKYKELLNEIKYAFRYGKMFHVYWIFFLKTYQKQVKNSSYLWYTHPEVLLKHFHQFYWDIIDICKLKMYIMLIRYTYILQNWLPPWC